MKLRAAIALQTVSFILTGIGFAGLGILAAARSLLGLREEEFMASFAGSAAVFTFSGIFVLGLLVLFPISVFMKRSAEAHVKRERIPIWGWLLIPLGVADPDWEMPPWIAWPARVLLVVSLVLLALLLVAVLIFVLLGTG